MTSLAPRFLLLFLFTFHTLQAPAFGAVKKLIRFSWEDLRSSNQIRLILEFQADSKPDALYVRSYENYTAGVVVTYGDNPKQPDLGKVAMTLKRTDEQFIIPILDAGQSLVSTDVNTIKLKASGSMILDMPIATILSGSELTYKPGEAVEATIEDTFNTPNSRFGKTNFYTDDIYTCKGEFYPRGGLKVTETTAEKKNGVTTHKLKFRTDKYPINGIVTAQIVRRVHDSRLPITYVMEKIWLEVHEDSITGPFPDGSVAVINGRPRKCRDVTCPVLCKGYGNDLDSVKIYRKSRSGEKTFLPGGVFRIMTPSYQRMVMSKVDRATVPTTIVCEAQLKDGKKAVTQFEFTKA